jgi:SAM-dependent methyltransferase
VLPPHGEARFARYLPPAPVSRAAGWDRGRPIDRRFIEAFLAEHRHDIRGHVLEFRTDRYTWEFGGDRVTASDVLDVAGDNPEATIVADLTEAPALEPEVFDCIICTQTLQMIFDVRAALRQLHRLLRPGGVLLVTGHGIDRISRRLGIDPWGEYWRFTAQSMRLLLEEVFPASSVTVKTYGNVLAATAFLYGLGARELAGDKLDHVDPDYEVIVAARAVK